MLDRATGEALLARLDAALSEVAEVRRQVVELMPPAAANGADDFAEHNVVSVQAASERFYVPQDTLRCWARREQGLGVRSGNVWRISVPALRRRLARRGE